MTLVLYKKDFCFEKYLNILPLPLSKYISKFRCLSHILPIEFGRFVLNIERYDSIRKLCYKNEFGDEVQLFNCDFFFPETELNFFPFAAINALIL